MGEGKGRRKTEREAAVASCKLEETRKTKNMCRFQGELHTKIRRLKLQDFSQRFPIFHDDMSLRFVVPPKPKALVGNGSIGQ